MKEKLIQLGLNENQAKIWLVVWQYGLSPASTIGKIAQMERTHAYKILQQLVEKGLIRISLRGSTNYFYVEDKEVLHTLLEQKKQEIKNNELQLQSLSEELDTLINPEISLIPPIRQRTGIEGVRQGLQDVINTCLREQLQQITFFGSKTLESLSTSQQSISQQWPEFFDEIANHQINIQGYEGTGVLILDHISEKIGVEDIKNFPTGKHTLYLCIVGQHIYYIFVRREPVMIKISSSEMSELSRIFLQKSVN